MRTLLLLRGSAGCGKSMWIENNNLKKFTLSVDDIRLLYQANILQADGTFKTNLKKDKEIWNTLYSILESRMKSGDFTVIDATNSKTSDMKKYKELADKYKYRIYIVDFTDIPIEEVKRRNNNRKDKTKIVPECVIDRMYARFNTQNIPSGIVKIKPDELDTIYLKPIDLSNYKKIHCIGDIHGCYSVLNTYLKDGIKDDECYIFVGDYIDRGIENLEILKFLIDIKDNKNVFLIEGNHERNLYYWSHNEKGSKKFEEVTKKELENLSKKEVRQLYKRFIQCAYFTYYDKVFLVTHGGLSTIPENLTFISTNSMIRGTGNYEDMELVADTFIKTTDDNVYQVFGHRNIKDTYIKVNERVYNLEGKVECGGYLRCIQITKDNIKVFETKNEVYNKDVYNKNYEENDMPLKCTEKLNLSDKLRMNKYINEKQYGSISSFNYTRKAFYNNIWHEQTIKARGLYIDTDKDKVVARAYNKFFNINENEKTQLNKLYHKIKFPVNIYLKENGFLGIVSYNEYTDDLLIATKSSLDGEYVEWFKNILYSKIKDIDLLKTYIKENNVSFVFECIDIINDPHIIQYDENDIILLDIIDNNIEFKKMPYNEVKAISNDFNIKCKSYVDTIYSWQDFCNFYKEATREDYKYLNKYIEGFVIEDDNGYMLKVKTHYYKFWKFLRGITEKVKKQGYINDTSVLTGVKDNEFYGYIRNLYNMGKDIPDIITLRNEFQKQRSN